MSNISNIVLVHGAWADASSWSKVIPLLAAEGLNVTAVQLPLNSYEADVAAVCRAIELEDGPVVLVGHSYGGSVVTQAGNHAKVAALVYIDGFAPDAGESAGSLFAQFESAPLNPEIRPDAAGFLKLSEAGIFDVFAQDLTTAEKSLLFATQGPISGAALGGVVAEAAWRTKSSWYLVGDQDRAIPRGDQEKMATRMNATVAHADASHVAMLAKPNAVADLICKAAG
ncbi:alpha/beta hydrolase [Tardiphaga sp. P9-11]|uniref:alpha/beta fold hydrolase n=1 Tax=Tardiphaga sp. P9-11 TaxID=2024614 RepID=UPI0011F30DC7|nr:alpha/beta hydrolase [Tardiphaga sp. P9-11]KAA0075888.1 alpha/beta hydrolase [Tardiphaga sp. P9-11]